MLLSHVSLLLLQRAGGLVLSLAGVLSGLLSQGGVASGYFSLQGCNVLSRVSQTRLNGSVIALVQLAGLIVG